MRTERNPLRAYELLLVSRPDVLVLDVYMPNCSGPELAAILREHDKFTQISGYSRVELIGRNHRILKSGEHIVEFYNALWQAISAGQVWQGEICNRRKDGNVYWVNSTIVPFLDREGVPYQYVSVRTDVTHIKQATLALIEAKNAADQANQAKSKFLSSMSHELRTPMNAILGFAQLMEIDESLSIEHRDGAAEIMKAGDHLLTLIGGVLDLAKIEAGRIELRIQALSCRTWVADCMGLVKPIADKQQITLHWDKDLDVVLLADRVRLRQVLLNLLSNAIKYNRIGGDVWLTTMIEGDRVRVTIADSGPGIAPERLSELFQPFRRLGAENGASEGTGLGLAITRNLVEMMNGKIGVSTEVGNGSQFWLELPTLESNRGDGEGLARFPLD